jgi:hypothetical protein
MTAGAESRQDDRARRLARRQPQRHARTDAERPRLVGGRRHHRAFRRVAAAADDQRHAGQLRTTEHPDRRDELVEVNMQHPPAEHVVHLSSLTPRQASTRVHRLIASLSNELTGITDPPAYRTARAHFSPPRSPTERAAYVKDNGSGTEAARTPRASLWSCRQVQGFADRDHVLRARDEIS